MEHGDNQRAEVDKTTMWLTDSDGSRTPEGSDSTPHTPPSPVAVPVHNQLPVVEPHITISPTSSPAPSPSKSNRSPKRVTTPKSRLGAIDENTDKVSPDLPSRDPRRMLGSAKLFSLAFPPTLHGSRRQPKRLWDDVEGPNGEKFSDLRNNKRGPRRQGWRRWMCLALIALAIGLIVAIILLAVLLTRNKRGNSNNNSNSGDNDTSTNSVNAFPAGTYKISSYLTTNTADCTSNPSTWTCYPSETHTQDSTIPPSNLTWSVARSSDSKSWTITSQDRIFNYPFANVPLNLENQGSDNEAYVFNYTYSKPTFPTTPIASVQARCYFNNTVLIGRLFTKKAKAAAFNEANGSQWPYAVEFQESISSGTDVPNCYEYVNAENGNPITVATGGNGGQCECGYSNYNV